MKTQTLGLGSLQLEPKKVFYGSFLSGISTTLIMFFIILTSDFLARHGFIHILLTLTGFLLTICAVWTGIKAIFQSGMGKKVTDVIVLLCSSLHALFAGFILILLIL